MNPKAYLVLVSICAMERKIEKALFDYKMQLLAVLFLLVITQKITLKNSLTLENSCFGKHPSIVPT